MNLQRVQGVSVLAALILISLWVGSIPVQPNAEGDYVRVPSDILEANPSIYEGKRVSTTVTINGSVVIDGVVFYTADSGCLLRVESRSNRIPAGSTMILRGTSFLESNNTILVHEYYLLDLSSSIIRSIPGIVLFVLMFFTVYRFTPRKMTFLPR